MGFDDCWLKAGPAPKISTANSTKRVVHETLLRSLIADLQSIQLRRLVDRASQLTTTAARPPRARRARPRDYVPADEHDEFAPPHVGHRAFSRVGPAARSTAPSACLGRVGKSLGQI